MPGFSTKSIDFSNPVKATQSIGLNLGGLVPKASLVDLDRLRTYTFQFNPETLKQPDVEAVYDNAEVAFRSHQRMRYKHTKSGQWVFQLYLNSISANGGSVINIINLSKNLNEDIAFLRSLVHPLQGSGIENRRPPIVRFVWPNTVNQRVRVLRVGSVYQEFNIRLQVKVAVIDITLQEDPIVNQTANLVVERANTGRPGLLGSVLDKLPSGFADQVDNIDSFI
ncbi:MAG: hypothetical protein V3T43_02895 [Nitrosomonadaceae bacterium]